MPRCSALGTVADIPPGAPGIQTGFAPAVPTLYCRGVRVKSGANSNPTPVLLERRGNFSLKRFWEVKGSNWRLSVLQGLKFSSLHIFFGVV